MRLDDLIEDGLSMVRANSAHNLEAGFRCRIMSYISSASGQLDRQRRTQLAVLSVERVLPIWDGAFPGNELPQRALKLAKNTLDGVIPSTDAKAEIGTLWTKCDDLSWKHVERQSIIMVGYGAVQAAREALSEKHFGCDSIKESTTDLDVDPYDHDSAFCAMVAESAGPPWDKSTDGQRRLAFWKWWLTIALRRVLSAA